MSWKFVLGQNKWVRSEQGETDASFLLADSTGRCLVDPAGAEILTNEKESWIEGDYRYTEWKIPQHNTVYVLGDFRTLSHEPSAYDMDSDISALLGEWKSDHAALLARFDRNHDGTIDLDEWEQARSLRVPRWKRTTAKCRLRPNSAASARPRTGAPTSSPTCRSGSWRANTGSGSGCT